MNDREAAALRSMVTRAKITNVQVGQRSILQITGLANESAEGVELLQPPGRSGNPAAGTDVVVLQVGATRDHLIALGGDTLGEAITDLQPGEFGDQDGRGNRVAYRTTMLEISTPLKLVITTPHFICSELPSSPAGLSTGEFWRDSNGYVHQV